MTTLEKVKAKMQELMDKKEKELQDIRQMQAETNAAIAVAEKQMQSAAEKLDNDGFVQAKRERQAAADKLEMLNRREAQLVTREFLTEGESDAVIDSLLEYEGELEAEFKKAVEVHLEGLRGLREKYLEAVEDTEKTISTWTNEIHRNYDTRGSVHFTDAETGRQTTRSATPVAVHPLGFHGCHAAELVGDFLQRYERQ